MMCAADLREMYAKYISCTIDVKSGWIPLVRDTIREIVATGVDFEITCIKEKFGGLRIYTDWKSGSEEQVDAAYDILSKYENKSLAVCEDCGKPGLLRTGGWVRTLCNLHAEGRKPSIVRMAKDHVCKNGWNVCSECGEISCTACSLACYDCVDAWRHRACAIKHHEETRHNGNINDLVYHLSAVELSSEASVLYGPHQ